MIAEKKIKREIMLARLAKLDEEERVEISTALQNNLFDTELWKQANSIGVYLSTENEWDTYNIVKEAYRTGKKVAIPKTIPETNDLKFYRIESLADTEEGNFSLREPNIDKVIQIYKNDIELLIVPGLVFSYDGYRIGYGGGYYDRYLKDFVYPTISLVHSTQIDNSIPIGPHDVPVNHVLTEEGLLE